MNYQFWENFPNLPDELSKFACWTFLILFNFPNLSWTFLILAEKLSIPFHNVEFGARVVSIYAYLLRYIYEIFMKFNLWNIILSHRCFDIFCDFELPKNIRGHKEEKRKYDCCRCVQIMNRNMDERRAIVNRAERKKYPSFTREENTKFHSPIKPITCPWGKLWFFTLDRNFLLKAFRACLISCTQGRP